jgi:hypothetical protein
MKTASELATDGVWAGPRRTEPQVTIVWTRNSPALKAANIGIAMGQRGLALCSKSSDTHQSADPIVGTIRRMDHSSESGVSAKRL